MAVTVAVEVNDEFLRREDGESRDLAYVRGDSVRLLRADHPLEYIAWVLDSPGGAQVERMYDILLARTRFEFTFNPGTYSMDSVGEARIEIPVPDPARESMQTYLSWYMAQGVSPVQLCPTHGGDDLLTRLYNHLPRERTLCALIYLTIAHTGEGGLPILSLLRSGWEITDMGEQSDLRTSGVRTVQISLGKVDRTNARGSVRIHRPAPRHTFTTAAVPHTINISTDPAAQGMDRTALTTYVNQAIRTVRQRDESYRDDSQRWMQPISPPPPSPPATPYNTVSRRVPRTLGPEEPSDPSPPARARFRRSGSS